jgi:hypothetical protein
MYTFSRNTCLILLLDKSVSLSLFNCIFEDIVVIIAVSFNNINISSVTVSDVLEYSFYIDEYHETCVCICFEW